MNNMVKIVLLLFVCMNSIQASELQKISLQLKWKYQFQFAGFIMAKEKGFYKDVGLDVAIREFDTSIDITKDVENKIADFGVSDSALVYNALKGESVVGLMPIFQHSPFILMGLKSSGIKNIQDINYKKVALYHGLDGISIQTMLKSNNVDYKEKPPTFSLKKLISGEVDLMSAYISNEPYEAESRNINTITFAPKDYGFEGYGDILFTSKNMLDNNPQQVQKFYTASKKGWNYAFSHIYETVALLHNKYNTLNKTEDALTYEANKLKEISGFGDNFGEFDYEKIKSIAQQFNLMNNENSKLENLTDFIYQPVKNSDYIKRGVNVVLGFDKPPFIFGKNSHLGIEADIIKECFDLMNYQVNITQNTNSYMQNILYRENDIDAVGTISRQGNKFFYSNVFTSYENYIISRKSDNLVINSLEDLENIKFVTWKNAYNDLGKKFHKLFNPFTGTLKSSYNENFSQKDDAKMFFSKQVSAIVVDKTIFNWFKLHFNNNDEYVFHDILKSKKTYPITFRNKKLKNEFNIALETLRSSGRYDEIINFYHTQKVEKFIVYTKLLAQITSKYLVNEDRKKLKTILEKFFIHPGIKNISLESDDLNLFLKKENGVTSEIKPHKLANTRTIKQKIYYEESGATLSIGQISIHYKKDFKSNNIQLIPLLESFKNLEEEDLSYIRSIYKKLGLMKNINLTKEELEYIKAKETLKVCVHPNQYPFVILNKSASGISIDYLNNISQQIDLKYKLIKASNHKEHLQMLKDGFCDVVPTVVTSPNKFEYLTTTNSIVTDNIVLVTNISEPYVDDFSNKKVGIQTGTKSLQQYVKSIYPDINLVEVDKYDMNRILNNEFYGYIGSSYQMSYKILKDYPNELKIMSKVGTTKIHGSFGVTNREPILLSILNKSIENISPTEIQKIQTTWRSIEVEKSFDYSLFWKVVSIFILITTVGVYITLKQRKLHKEIKTLNDTLEMRVKDEVEKNQRHQILMLQQSRLAQMGEMISMIAHQWRQPLNNLSLVSQGLFMKYKRGKLDDTAIEMFEQSSKKQILQMSRTIDDFRNFFKPEKEKEVFNLSEALENTIDLVRPYFDREHISFEVSIDSEIYINGYPGEFGQALINIINNAKDALIENQEDKRYINIYTLNDKKDTFLLIIEDNAKGIPEDMIDKIFDPYFSTKLDKNGTGIGLYMTKMIIEEHMDSTLKVENTEDGAKFTLGFKQVTNLI